MEGYTGALELTVIALGALLLISFGFMGLTRALQWLAARSGGGGKVSKATLKHPAAAEAPAAPATAAEVTIAAPMPARVSAIRVSVGDKVKCGDVLLMLEEWEMLYELSAPGDGSVKQVFVAEGAYVKKGAPLIVISG